MKIVSSIGSPTQRANKSLAGWLYNGEIKRAGEGVWTGLVEAGGGRYRKAATTNVRQLGKEERRKGEGRRVEEPMSRTSVFRRGGGGGGGGGRGEVEVGF